MVRVPAIHGATVVHVAMVCLCAAPALAAPAAFVVQERPLAKAEALVREGRAAEAARLVRDRLARAPDDLEAQALLGRVLLSLGDPNSEALDLLERAVTAGRTDIPTLLALGHARAASAGTQHDPSMRRILEVGAKEAFGTAAATARQELQRNPSDRLFTKALADALRFQGELLESARTAAALLVRLKATTGSALSNDVAAGLRDAVMRMPEGERRSAGVPLVADTVARDLARPKTDSHRVLAHIYVELLRRHEDWPTLAAIGPRLLDRYAGDRVMPYTIALALQHRAVDLPETEATALRLAAARIYIGWIAADRSAGVSATVAHSGFQGAFSLATALINRGKSAEGRLVFDELHAALPVGRTRGWVTSARAIEAKEDGDVATALELYRIAIEQDHPEPASGPQSADLAFLANQWSDLGLVHLGRAHQLGFAVPGARESVAAARDAFTRAIGYADRAVAMRPAGGGVYQQSAVTAYNFAVYARMNLARLEDREGRRPAAIALVRRALRYAAAHPVPQKRLDATLTLRELLARWR